MNLRPLRPSLRAIHAALAAVIVVVLLSGAASAAEPPGLAARKSYAIAPGSLGNVLAQFAAEAGAPLSFNPTPLTGIQSPGLTGSYTVQEGFDRLLSGTGYTLIDQGDGTYFLKKLPPQTTAGATTMLPPVKVLAAPETPTVPPPYAGGQVARGGRLGLLGDRDVMDTPFTQMSYTAQTIQDQQARNLADVVANDPSVRNSFPGASYLGSWMIRGFAVNNNDIAFDGLYGVAPPAALTPEYVERVEVLEGPSALLNGAAPSGSVGGNVNIVPKRAGAVPLAELTADYVSDSQFGGHVDVGQRFGPDDELGVRFNGVYRKGDSTVDRQSQLDGAAVLSLDYRSERVRLTFDLGWQKEDFNSPLRPIALNAGVPVPVVPRNTTNWAQPWAYVDDEDTFGAIRAEVDLNAQWTAFAAFGARYTLADSVYGTGHVIAADGTFTDSPFHNQYYSQANTEAVGLRGKVPTGPVEQELILSATRLAEQLGDLFPGLATITSNIYDPVLLPRPSIANLYPPETSATNLATVAFADVLSALDGKVQLIPGGRWQKINTENISPTTNTVTSSYDKQAVTPAVGLSVKPWGQGVSLYANYIEGLQQGSTAPAGTVNTGEIFPPFKTKQYEAGAKVDFGRLLTTFSLFQIQQPSGITDPTTNIYGIAGQQRNRGVELQTFGEMADGVRLLGGVMYIDGELTRTQAGANNDNNAPGVPHIQANLGGEWDTPFLRGLTFSGRAVETSPQYVNVANTQRIAGWITFDAGVRYKFKGGNTPITLRANVQNLTNRDYWSSSVGFGAGYLSLGEPRTFLLSATADF